jgi:hypothetical protein
MEVVDIDVDTDIDIIDRDTHIDFFCTIYLLLTTALAASQENGWR